MVSFTPYRTAIKKRIVRNLFLINILFFLPLSLTSQINAQVATQSGYSLVGTIQSGDFSGAVISVAKGEQSFFRLFEKLPDGSQIVAVRPDYITLKGPDGVTYELFILHETKNVASVQREIPADPYAGGRYVEPQQPNAQALRHRRMRAARANEED